LSIAKACAPRNDVESISLAGYTIHMPVAINTVILDFGGVLGLPQDPQRVAAMAELAGLSPKEFLASYREDRLELDRGTLATEEYWGRILRRGGVEPTPDFVARIEHEDTLGWSRVNQDMVRWTRELRAARYKTGILSNMPIDKLSFMRANEEFAWIDDFDVVVFSCEYKLVKPDPAIYLLCLERLAVKPAQSLFLDDTRVNIEAAAALGINTHHFQSSSAAAGELRDRWGLPVASLDGNARSGRAAGR
jgi:putative hydrolase of the HAD superfamily